jgi:hypothetical protein
MTDPVRRVRAPELWRCTPDGWVQIDKVPFGRAFPIHPSA